MTGCPIISRTIALTKSRFCTALFGLKKVVDLLPAEVRPFATDFRHHVVRDPLQVQAELDSDPSAMPRRPYRDPLLQKDPLVSSISNRWC